MGAGVGGDAGASVIVTVRGHGKGQGLEVGTDLLGQVEAQVSGVAVSLALGVGERPRAEVGPHLGVLQKDAGKLSDPALSPHSAPGRVTPPCHEDAQRALWKALSCQTHTPNSPAFQLQAAAA